MNQTEILKALYDTCLNGDFISTKYLIEKGNADWSIEDNDQTTAFHVAVMKGN